MTPKGSYPSGWGSWPANVSGWRGPVMRQAPKIRRQSRDCGKDPADLLNMRRWRTGVISDVVCDRKQLAERRYVARAGLSAAVGCEGRARARQAVFSGGLVGLPPLANVSWRARPCAFPAPGGLQKHGRRRGLPTGEGSRSDRHARLPHPGAGPSREGVQLEGGGGASGSESRGPGVERPACQG